MNTFKVSIKYFNVMIYKGIGKYSWFLIINNL
jgi:hypothetical protein